MFREFVGPSFALVVRLKLVVGRRQVPQHHVFPHLPGLHNCAYAPLSTQFLPPTYSVAEMNSRYRLSCEPVCLISRMPLDRKEKERGEYSIPSLLVLVIRNTPHANNSIFSAFHPATFHSETTNSYLLKLGILESLSSETSVSSKPQGAGNFVRAT